MNEQRNVLRNVFQSNERALPMLLAMFLVLGAPLDAQEFGAAVAIGADEILIGEPLNQRRPSTIYRYRQSATGWEQVGTIQAPPPGRGADYFGRFIAMDDRSMLIGGTLYENSTGTVWSYHREGADWAFDAMVRPDSLAEGEAFGRRISDALATNPDCVLTTTDFFDRRLTGSTADGSAGD